MVIVREKHWGSLILYYLKIWPPQPKKNTYPWSTALWNSPTAEMTLSAEEAIHMRDQKNKQMFITGLRYRNDCLFDVCAARAAARLGCLGFRPQCEPTASLSGLKSRQLGTQQMRWIMLIHGGELWENVCFTLQCVCAHVYWCLDCRALSKWDCGLISPSTGSLGYIQTAIRTTTDVACHRVFQWRGRCTTFALLIMKYAGGEQYGWGQQKKATSYWGWLIYLDFLCFGSIALQGGS